MLCDVMGVMGSDGYHWMGLVLGDVMGVMGCDEFCWM